MTSTIITKNSSTASSVPLAADLTQGELAVNVTDKRLFTENASGTVVELGTNPSSLSVVGNATVGGTLGVTGATTLAGVSATTLSASSTVTLSGGTANGVTYLNGSKVLTSGSALTFDGTRLTSTTGKFGGGAASNSASLMVNNATNTATGIQLFQDGIESWIMGMPANSAGLAWSASGSEQMRLTSTGLGIGTSSPTNYGAGYKTVSANGSSSGVFELQAGGTAQAILVADNTDLQIQALGARPIRFFTNGNQRATIDSSGNLGLGVTPSASWASGTQSFQFGPSSALYNPGSGSRAVLASNAIFTSGVSTATYITSNAAAYYDQDNGSHKWNIAPSGTAGNPITFTQALTLDASGNVLCGVTSATNDPTQGITLMQNGNIGNIGIGHATGTASGNSFVKFSYNGTTIGNIAQSGTTAVAYNTSSDYRLKNTIAPMTGALAKVAQLKPVTYKWNADGSNGEGFIAHELAEVCPHAVTGEKDAVNEDGTPKYQGIDTSFLVATLTAAIQELKAEFDAYKASHP